MTTTINKAFFLIATVLVLGSCRMHEEVFFDTPFVRIEDQNGGSSATVDAKLDNVLTQLQVVVSASKHYFEQPVNVEYEIVTGAGLKEGEDFRIQSSHRSPLTFQPGTYTLPIRVMWYRTDGFDPSKDNTLTIRLTGVDHPDFMVGLPGPDSKKKEFIFTKQ